jgi:hypothetical protein
MVSLGVIGLLLLSPTIVLAGSVNNSTVLPPNAKPQGLTQGVWATEVVKFLYATPASENPITGSTGNQCVVKFVKYVALVLTNPGSPESYHCSVPQGTMLVMPAGGVFCDTLSRPFPTNEAELRDCVTIFYATDVQASIDGVAIEDVESHLVQSPPYTITPPEGNIYGLPANTSGQGMIQTHLLIFTPLPKGEHTLHIHSFYPEVGNYEENFTLQITVEP